jgi:hypothetical protein
MLKIIRKKMKVVPGRQTKTSNFPSLSSILPLIEPMASRGKIDASVKMITPLARFALNNEPVPTTH